MTFSRALRPFICNSCLRKLRNGPNANTTSKRFAAAVASPSRKIKYSGEKKDSRRREEAKEFRQKTERELIPHEEKLLSERKLNLYKQLNPPNTAQLNYASTFFHKYAPKFLASFPSFRLFPKSDVPEIAFLGASNVGKSTLVNFLFRGWEKEVIAYASKTPGRTREMVAFAIGPNLVNVPKSEWKEGKKIEWDGPSRWCGRGGLVVVDMPGYGTKSQDEWGRQILKYLSGRKQLRRAFVLVDVTQGIKGNDAAALKLMRERGVPHQIILTKADMLLFGFGRDSAKSPEKHNLQSRVDKLKKVQEAVHEHITKENDGQAALADVLTVSAGPQPGGKGAGPKVGVNGVRWAVLQAVGLECDHHGRRVVHDSTSIVEERDDADALPEELSQSPAAAQRQEDDRTTVPTFIERHTKTIPSLQRRERRRRPVPIAQRYRRPDSRPPAKSLKRTDQLGHGSDNT